MRNLKIILSIVFVLVVSFFVIRGCVHKRTPSSEYEETQEEKIPIKKSVAAKPAAKKARLAIILDDWGENLALTKDVLDIGRPLTLSIIPHLKHSKEIAELA